MQEISVQELKQKIDQGDQFTLIDVREPYEFEEFNLNGTLIPLGDLMNQVESLKLLKTAEVIVHCRSGARSAMATQMLESMGFSDVKNLAGGVLAWQQAFGQ